LPKQVPPNEVRVEQLLLRLTAAEFDVLDAAAHLRQLTPNAYAYDLLRTHLARLSTDEFVQEDLRNRQRFEQTQASTVALRRTSRKAV
jgi:hypothetical protein